jgi:RNA polymerase sigma-70 factor (ECF subfamily)
MTATLATMSPAAVERGARRRAIPEASDADLAVAAREGSEGAFRELVERFQRPVFRLVGRMLRDPAAAEDVTQETFVKAYRNLASYDPGRKFSSWLFKIAHNATLDHLRRRELDTVPLESPGDEAGGGLRSVLADPTARGPEVGARRGELAAALEGAVAGLRPEYREVVLLRFAEGLAYEEIREVTGLPLGTVKTHLHRARKELMTALVARGFGPGGLG